MLTVCGRERRISLNSKCLELIVIVIFLITVSACIWFYCGTKCGPLRTDCILCKLKLVLFIIALKL